MNTTNEYDVHQRLQLLKQYSKPCKFIQDSEDPFHMFLRFVALSLKKSGHAQLNQIISQIKQRYVT